MPVGASSMLLNEAIISVAWLALSAVFESRAGMYCHKIYQMKDTWAFGPLLRDDLVEGKLEFLHYLAASFEPFDRPGIERINLRPNSFLRSQEFFQSQETQFRSVLMKLSSRMGSLVRIG
jgi:hypothetical protein